MFSPPNLKEEILDVLVSQLLRFLRQLFTAAATVVMATILIVIDNNNSTDLPPSAARSYRPSAIYAVPDSPTARPSSRPQSHPHRHPPTSIFPARYPPPNAHHPRTPRHSLRPQLNPTPDSNLHKHPSLPQNFKTKEKLPDFIPFSLHLGKQGLSIPYATQVIADDLTRHTIRPAPGGSGKGQVNRINN